MINEIVSLLIYLNGKWCINTFVNFAKGTKYDENTDLLLLLFGTTYSWCKTNTAVLYITSSVFESAHNQHLLNRTLFVGKSSAEVEAGGNFCHLLSYGC